MIGRIHNVLIRPFKVKRIANRLPNARIAKLRAACIKDPTLRANRQATGQFFLFHAPLAHSRKIISRCPLARGIFFDKIQLTRFERLKGNLPLAKIFIAQAIKIIGANIHRQIRAPIIFDALEFNKAALLEFG